MLCRHLALFARMAAKWLRKGLKSYYHKGHKEAQSLCVPSCSLCPLWLKVFKLLLKQKLPRPKSRKFLFSCNQASLRPGFEVAPGDGAVVGHIVVVVDLGR